MHCERRKPHLASPYRWHRNILCCNFHGHGKETDRTKPQRSQEAFCRGLAEGKSQIDANRDAGYVGAYNVLAAGATQSLKNPKIASRVAELQAKAAETAGITIKSLTDDLIRLRMLAEANAQVAAFPPLA